MLTGRRFHGSGRNAAGDDLANRFDALGHLRSPHGIVPQLGRSVEAVRKRERSC